MQLDTLILSLPSRHATLRMRVWRALKDGGWGVLRDGVYVVRVGGADRAMLGKLQSAIRAAGGTAMFATLALGDGEAPETLFDQGPNPARSPSASTPRCGPCRASARARH